MAELNNAPLLEVKDLKKYFDVPKGKLHAVDGVNFKIMPGETIGVVGESGCGKSTLLRCIAGFEKYSGKILVNDIETSVPSPNRIMVFQDYNQLFPWKTVEKNIQFPLKVCGIKDKKQLQKLSNNALKMVHLTSYAKYYPHQLSGGMKQRVAIAKALVQKPEIILMDEPFAALDAITRSSLQKLTKEIYELAGVEFNISSPIQLGEILFEKMGIYDIL